MVDIKATSSELTSSDRFDHFKARFGYKRMDHLVAPGLYSLGSPTKGSPVLVTANYTLSFDALRSSLKGLDCYIMVINTYGINVWCAAGKGTFGTDEVVNRIELTGLADVVSHRELILPQLGAPGVSAHQVKKRSGFNVRYGPVRAVDLPEYLRNGATAKMRKVTFTLRERAEVVPVELVASMLPMVIIALALFFLGGAWASLAVVMTVVTGAILVPLLLPILPGKDLTVKGLFAGTIMALLITATQGTLSSWAFDARSVSYAVVLILLMSPWVGYLALNFTGSTTFTSRTGVKKEIFTYLPILATLFVVGAGLDIVLALTNAAGWY